MIFARILTAIFVLLPLNAMSAETAPAGPPHDSESRTENARNPARGSYYLTETAKNRDIALQKLHISAVRTAVTDLKGEQYLRDNIPEIRDRVILNAADFVMEEKVLSVIDNLNGRVKVTASITVNKDRISEALNAKDAKPVSPAPGASANSESTYHSQTVPEWLTGFAGVYLLLVAVIVIITRIAGRKSSPGKAAAKDAPGKTDLEADNKTGSDHSPQDETARSDTNDIARISEAINDIKPTEPVQTQDAMMPSAIISYELHLIRNAASPANSRLDEMFAEANGLWICKYCETLNTFKSCRCIACGSLKE
ncbi:hypothetical protein [Succinimonas amylolytica]|uniref:hypothetical protein n=1 Tax=Succinimonas amylolytica TaxID=83769 RepID=UPI000364EFFD|nr:hypothetical protein [Succinimonas amylolytica]